MSELTEDACRVCGSEEDEAFLVLCDGCDRPFHTYCHAGCVCCRQKPKGLFNKKPAVPDGDWYCKFCAGPLPKLEDKASAISSIFVWGDNEDGQLGLPDTEDKVVWSPKRVHELDGIGVVCIACTETATVAICNDGNLYSVGTGTSGQLGHQDIVHEKLTKFRQLESVVAEKRSKREGPFKQISAGRDFFLALTTEGHVYTWGNGEHGQLGHQDNKNKKVPKKISALREWDVPADLATCGGDFILMTSTDPPIDDQFNTQKPGVLMTIGANTHGQLGDGSGRNQWLPQRLNKEAPEFTPKSNTEIEDPTECLLGRDLRLLSAGNAHAVVVTSTMKGAWAWGFGEVGCLGIPRPPAVSGQSKFFHQRFRVPRPRYIKALENEMVNQVACGGQHTLLLLADGRVMSMGDNEFGQLGVKDHDPDKISVVEFQTAGKIKQIAAGDKHSVALTTAGEVYTWGENKLGQLGLGATITDPVFEPTKVVGIGRMKKVYVGPNQIFAVEYTNDEIDLPVVETSSEPTRGKKRGAGSSKQPIKKGKK